VERSITQADGRDGGTNLKARDARAAMQPESESESEEAADRPETAMELLGRIARNRTLWGIGLVLLCFAAYYFIQPNRTNIYMHFVLQAQSWLDGNTAIPTPGYQDVMPLGVHLDGSSCVATADDPSCMATGYGIIPFPPLPAWVLLPFVALWRLSTDEHLLAMIFAAIDVGIAYWMLGYLPVRHGVRVLTSLFLGLGTVLWYAAAIGSTWFWAHIVGVGCLLLSVGLALSADPDATEPRPLRGIVTAVRGFRWSGGWTSVAVVVALGAGGELLFRLADVGTSAASLAAVGVALGLVAATLAVVVADRPGVLVPFLIVVAVVGGVPLLLLATVQSPAALQAIDVFLLVLVIGLWWLSARYPKRMESGLALLRGTLSSPESRQVAAGLLFGLAVTARLTILFGFPFLILVGGGGSWLRRAMLAGAGAAVPVVALVVYTYAVTGQLFNPAYQYQYGVELVGYGSILNYNPAWSITDIRYIPQNLGILLLGAPRLLPHFSSVFPGDSGDQLCVNTAVRGLFDRTCPVAIPEATGTSILLTSPAFLLAPLAWGPIRRLRIDRATVGATIAVLGIATVNLMHFSQGWVQFGYRFSNDFVPFALILVALGATRLGRLWPVLLLVGASILINFWGTTWGVILGW
jgi:hypothetical protein